MAEDKTPDTTTDVKEVGSPEKEDKKKKLDEDESDNTERDVKKQRVEPEVGATTDTEDETAKLAAESQVKATTTEDTKDTEEAASTITSTESQPSSSTLTTTPTTDASLAAAMNMANAAAANPVAAATLAQPSVAISHVPTTPQGLMLASTHVTTDLVVPKPVVQVSVAAVNQLQNSLAASGVSITYSASAMSEPPVMSHETVITIAGPFMHVHNAYVSLVRLAYGDNLSETKITVANDEASALIGKAGCAIREIRLGLGGAPNCIKILEKNPMFPNQKRLVTFTGNIELVLKAHELVQEKIIAFRNGTVSTLSASVGTPTSSNGAELTTQVQVPNEALGAVIGKAGSRIQEIRRLSAAKVTIEPQVDLQPARLVTIVGNNESVEWAKYLINIAMAGGEPSQSLGNSVPPGMVATLNHQMQTGGAMGGGPQYSVADLQGAGYTPEQITAYMVSQGQEQPGFHMLPTGGMKLVLPNEQVGSIIGKSGCKINQMRKLTGARINILEPLIGAAVRSVTIEGDAMSLPKAQLMLTMAQAGVDVSAWQPHDLQNAMQQQQGVLYQQQPGMGGGQYGHQQPGMGGGQYGHQQGMMGGGQYGGAAGGQYGAQGYRRY